MAASLSKLIFTVYCFEIIIIICQSRLFIYFISSLYNYFPKNQEFNFLEIFLKRVLLWLNSLLSLKSTDYFYSSIRVSKKFHQHIIMLFRWYEFLFLHYSYLLLSSSICLLIFIFFIFIRFICRWEIVFRVFLYFLKGDFGFSVFLLNPPFFLYIFP